MTTIGELNGTGTLVLPGGAEIPTDYRITVSWVRNIKSARGTLSGASEMDYAKAQRGDEHATLRLSSGEDMQINLTRVSGDHALIEVSGPVPGF